MAAAPPAPDAPWSMNGAMNGSMNGSMNDRQALIKLRCKFKQGKRSANSFFVPILSLRTLPPAQR